MGVFLVITKRNSSEKELSEQLTARLGSYTSVFEPEALGKDDNEFTNLVQRNLIYQVVTSGELPVKTSGFQIAVMSELASFCEQLTHHAKNPDEKLEAAVSRVDLNNKNDTFTLYEERIKGGSLKGEHLQVELLLKQNNL